jgi:hypothetical protein
MTGFLLGANEGNRLVGRAQNALATTTQLPGSPGKVRGLPLALPFDTPRPK